MLRLVANMKKVSGNITREKLKEFEQNGSRKEMEAEKIDEQMRQEKLTKFENDLKSLHHEHAIAEADFARAIIETKIQLLSMIDAVRV